VCDKPDFCHADEEAGNTMQKARALSMLPTPNRFFCERKKAIIRKSVSPASILTKEKDQGRGVWSVSKTSRVSVPLGGSSLCGCWLCCCFGDRSKPFHVSEQTQEEKAEIVHRPVYPRLPPLSHPAEEAKTQGHLEREKRKKRQETRFLLGWVCGRREKSSGQKNDVLFCLVVDSLPKKRIRTARV